MKYITKFWAIHQKMEVSELRQLKRKEKKFNKRHLSDAALTWRDLMCKYVRRLVTVWYGKIGEFRLVKTGFRKQEIQLSFTQWKQKNYHENFRIHSFLINSTIQFNNIIGLLSKPSPSSADPSRVYGKRTKWMIISSTRWFGEKIYTHCRKYLLSVWHYTFGWTKVSDYSWIRCATWCTAFGKYF